MPWNIHYGTFVIVDGVKETVAYPLLTVGAVWLVSTIIHEHNRY